ncbi:MAG: hypothetical protein IT425_14830 [Pirellulales bacterium]|nr:hypothetical protein [Pirellulales bacterium]
MKTANSLGKFLCACLLGTCALAAPAWAEYDTTDPRLPSPNYHSTNAIQFNTPDGVFVIDSFFDIFTELQRLPVPPAGSHRIDSFFDVFTELSVHHPVGTLPVQTFANMEIWILGSQPGEPFDTEMLSLSLQGGDLPANIRVRESPSRPSTGKGRITDLGGGIFRVDSFFDIFTELSLDGGEWIPASGPLHIVGSSPAVPEPASATLLALGSILLTSGLLRRRGR